MGIVETLDASVDVGITGRIRIDAVAIVEALDTRFVGHIAHRCRAAAVAVIEATDAYVARIASRGQPPTVTIGQAHDALLIGHVAARRASVTM